MSWKGVPDVPPPGYVSAMLRAGDDLATLEREEVSRRGLPATQTEWSRVGLEISAANGVEGAKAKTCEWARGVSAWVVGTGGARAPVVPSMPNNCEPGEGFAMFAPGQRIYLPEGLRPTSTDAPKTDLVVAVKQSPWPRVVMGVAAAVVARRVFRRLRGSR